MREVAQFLPGPWYLGAMPSDLRCHRIVNRNDILVAEAFGTFDARLICAAPDLYAVVCALDDPALAAALATVAEDGCVALRAQADAARAQVERYDPRLFPPDRSPS